jgi:methyl-accepting chemotaxis protein
MNWLKKAKVGARLVLAFSFMILILGTIGLVGYVSIKNIKHELDGIFAVNLPSIDLLIETDRDLQQLLVAERSMIFANAKSELFQQLLADYQENFEQSADRWTKYQTLQLTAAEKEIISEYMKARKEWEDTSRQVVDGRIADTRQGRRLALDLSLGLAKEKFEGMRQYLDQLTELNLQYAAEAHSKAVATYEKAVFSLIAVLAAGLVAGVLLMWLLSRGITRPLSTVMAGLNQASEQVASASTELSGTSNQLAEGASEQAAALEESSSSLEEMSSMTRQNADNAKQANNLMQEANQVVDEANQAMTALTASMSEISKASEETSKIVKTIDEIAFQTNLLALNAAVEAARAGESGAGFAVVADEVRNLAMRAAEAARNTAVLIEGTVKKVQDGVELVAKSDEAFTKVSRSSHRVGELVAEIAAASDEQAHGIEQINRAVTEMDRVVQQTAASAQESAAASQEMDAQAEYMRNYVGQLADLVGRHKGNREQADDSRSVSGMKSPVAGSLPPAKGKSGKANGAVQSHRETSPKNMIPLPEDGFEDF